MWNPGNANPFAIGNAGRPRRGLAGLGATGMDMPWGQPQFNRPRPPQSADRFAAPQPPMVAQPQAASPLVSAQSAPPQPMPPANAGVGAFSSPAPPMGQPVPSATNQGSGGMLGGQMGWRVGTDPVSGAPPGSSPGQPQSTGLPEPINPWTKRANPAGMPAKFNWLTSSPA